MVLIRDLSIYDDAPVVYDAYDGLVIRCYNGTSKDARFEVHKAGAKQGQTPWWAYAFYNFNYPAAPQVQAVINILRDEPGAIVPAFDVEEWKTYKYPPRSTLLANLKILHDGWYAFDGDHCQFYMNPATIHYLKPIPSWLLECPLWLAHWGVSKPDFEPWQNFTFWQYHGEPDLNCYSGTDTEYWDYVGGTPPPPPPLPDKVRVTASVLNIRKTPGGVLVGYCPLGTIFGVIGEACDGNGKVWYKVGDNSWIASWWTEIYSE